MTEFLNPILKSLGWSETDIVKKKHGISSEIIAKDFILAILSTDSIPEAASYLNIGTTTIHRIFTKKLIPIFGNCTGGNNTWKLRLLHNANIKYCSNCNNYLSHDSFTKDISTFDKLDRKCKFCKSAANASYYDTNKETYHKQYIEEHRAEYNARNAKRKASKLQATPAWSDLEKIKEIYNNCPVGHHVDHIYPLISNWVCGLHVPENLQYLPAKENMRKGNRKFATVA